MKISEKTFWFHRYYHLNWLHKILPYIARILFIAGQCVSPTNSDVTKRYVFQLDSLKKDEAIG